MDQKGCILFNQSVYAIPSDSAEEKKTPIHANIRPGPPRPLQCEAIYKKVYLIEKELDDSVSIIYSITIVFKYHFRSEECLVTQWTIIELLSSGAEKNAL